MASVAIGAVACSVPSKAPVDALKQQQKKKSHGKAAKARAAAFSAIRNISMQTRYKNQRDALTVKPAETEAALQTARATISGYVLNSDPSSIATARETVAAPQPPIQHLQDDMQIEPLDLATKVITQSTATSSDTHGATTLPVVEQKEPPHRIIPSENETTACFDNAISDAGITASTLQSMKQAERQLGLATPKSLTNPRPRISFRSSKTATLALPPVKESEQLTRQQDSRQTVRTTRPSHEPRRKSR